MANRHGLKRCEMKMIHASFEEGLRGQRRSGRDLVRDIWLWLLSWSRFRNDGDLFEQESAQRARAEFMAGLNGDGASAQTSERVSEASARASARDLCDLRDNYREKLERKATAEFREALHRKKAAN